MVEEPSQPYYLPIAGGRIIGFIPFPRVFVLCEMQSVWSRIWTRVIVSLSYDDNHYTTCTSRISYKGIEMTAYIFLHAHRGLISGPIMPVWSAVSMYIFSLVNLDFLISSSSHYYHARFSVLTIFSVLTCCSPWSGIPPGKKRKRKKSVPYVLEPILGNYPHFAECL